MSFSADPNSRVTRALSDERDPFTRSTQPLDGAHDQLADMPTIAHTKLTNPLTTPISATKQPVVIPAAVRRQRAKALQNRHSHIRPIVMIGVLLGSIIMLTVAASFVAPLGNGQRSQSLAQTVNNWFSNGQTNSINAAQHVDPPTPTPALLTGEGYCGGGDLWGTCATAVTASGVMGSGLMQRPIKGAVITQ